MQTQIRDSKPIHIGGIITIGQAASMPTQPQNVTGSQPSFTRIRPPYTTPIRWPQEIIAKILTYQELQAWIGFIQAKQKTHAEWDDIGKRMPPELRDKTALVLKECKQNGFINPHISNGKLAWSQILGHERNRKYNCQCDLCDNDTTSGTCRGRFVNNNQGHRDFKPCWEK